MYLFHKHENHFQNIIFKIFLKMMNTYTKIDFISYIINNYKTYYDDYYKTKYITN